MLLCTSITGRSNLISVFDVQNLITFVVGHYRQIEERFMSTSGLMYLKGYFNLTVKLEQYRQLMTMTS